MPVTTLNDTIVRWTLPAQRGVVDRVVTRDIFRGLTLITQSVALGVTFTRVDSTRVRVDFAAPVLLIPPLTWPGSYELDPLLTVISVTPGPSSAGPIFQGGATWPTVLYVTLTTEEQSPATYDGIVFGLEAAN